MKALILKSLSLTLALLYVGSCASTRSTGDPTETAVTIVEALDQGQRAKADALFPSGRGDEEARERLYPRLYGEAQRRYETGAPAAAVRVLDYLAEHYPDAVAVHQARVYSLFLERADSAQPDPALVEETATALATWREKAASPPHWADLIETQVRIDRGDLAGAREAFERFVVGWNGRPEALAIYVEDVDRYLASH